MLRKGSVPESTGKDWEEQQALLLEVEFIPNIAEEVWGVTTYKAVTDIDLLLKILVRTSSVDSNGNQVNVGNYFEKGLFFCPWCDDVSMASASARK